MIISSIAKQFLFVTDPFIFFVTDPFIFLFIDESYPLPSFSTKIAHDVIRKIS